MTMTAEWKIRAEQVFPSAPPDEVLTVRVQGRKISISMDGANWQTMGQVVIPAGMAGQSSYSSSPMEWDAEKNDVVPAKGF